MQAKQEKWDLYDQQGRKQERPFRQARMFRMDIACTVLVSG